MRNVQVESAADQSLPPGADWNRLTRGRRTKKHSAALSTACHGLHENCVKQGEWDTAVVRGAANSGPGSEVTGVTPGQKRGGDTHARAHAHTHTFGLHGGGGGI